MTNQSNNNNNIIIWVYKGFKEITETICEKLASDYPETQVLVEEKNFDEINEALNQYQVYDDKTSLPDILLVYNADVYEYLKEYKFLFKALNDSMSTGCFIPTIENQIKISEKYYACPFTNEQIALYYRKDIYQEFVSNSNKLENPTWEQFFYDLELLKSNLDIHMMVSIRPISEILMKQTGEFYYKNGQITSGSAYEVLELIEAMSNRGYLFNDQHITLDEICTLIKDSNIFSIIATPKLFTEIKKIVETNSLEQIWGVIQLPKEDCFLYDVNYGGYSYMQIDKKDSLKEEYFERLLSELLMGDREQSVDLYCELSERFDNVPPVLNRISYLDQLTNNGCFYDEQVISYLHQISLDVPILEQCSVSKELNDEFKKIAQKVQKGELSAIDGATEFQDICNQIEYIPLELVNIDIEQLPDQIQYYDYEYFDPTGLIVRAYYTDGSSEIITNYSYYPAQLRVYDTYVTISYSSGLKTCTKEIEVEVLPRNIIGIHVMPNKDFYLQGIEFQTSDFKVELLFQIGEESEITNFTIEPKKPFSLPTEVVTITYSEASLSSSIIVPVKKSLQSISITKEPIKTVYFEGEYFDPAGMTVVATYSDATSEVVNDYFVLTNQLTFVDTIVEIAYSLNDITRKAYQAITVLKNELKEIKIVNNRQSKFIEGQIANKEDISVEAFYLDGSSQYVTSFTLLEEGEALTSSVTVLTAEYTENGITKYATTPIEVYKRELTGITIQRIPNKIVYHNTSEIDLQGLILTITFNNKVQLDFNYDDYMEDISGYLELNPLIDPSKMETIFETVTQHTGIVIIAYTDGTVTKYTFYNVEVIFGDLISIYVEGKPKQYYVGESFTLEGLKVYGNTQFNSVIELIDNCTVSNQPLKITDKFVTVFYQENAQSRTYQAKVPVTVLEKNVDNSKKDQIELTYHSDLVNARLNLFHKRMTLDYFDASIGVNSYFISCRHIYNSLFYEKDELIYNKQPTLYYKTYMGEQFKLSLQQYLLYDETNDVFTYIDQEGYRHCFESLHYNNQYYDITGTNLLLDKINDTYILSDQSGNRLYFKDGLIRKAVSCYNDNYVKLYNYDEIGRLKEVYDKRKQSEKIVFEYDDTTKLLSKIKCVKDEIVKKEIHYAYTQINNAMYLTKITNGDNICIFDYDLQNHTVLTYNDKTKSFLKYEYERNNDVNLVKLVKTGVLKEENNQFIENILQQNQLQYTNDQYTVTVINTENEKTNFANDIAMVYHFNAGGFTTSIFEQVDNNANQLKTLQKEPGVDIEFGESDTTSWTINNHVSYQYNDGQMKYTTIPQSFNLKHINDYRKGKCNNYDNFNVSFYAKLKYALTNPKISVTVKSKKKSFTGTAVLDNTAIDVWQLVVIPVSIHADRIDEISIYMKYDYHQGVSIADARINYASENQFVVLGRINFSKENIDLFDFSPVLLEECDAISYTPYDTNEQKTIDINETCYITESDLKYTFLNQYQNSTTNFILSLCDCTKKIRVKQATIQMSNFLSCEISPYDMGSYKLLKFLNIVNSPDGCTYSTSSVLIHPSLTIGNYTGPVIEGITENMGSEKNVSSTTIETYADFFGRILKEVDEYGLTTTYEYNLYGEIQKKTIGHKDTNEEIISESIVNDTESISKTKVSNDKTKYNSTLGYVESASFGGSDEEDDELCLFYEYNQDYTQLYKIRNNLDGKNVLTYKNTLLSEVTPTEYKDSDSYGYKIEYDAYNNPSEYFMLSGENKTSKKLTSTNIDYEHATIDNYVYRTSDNQPDCTKTTLDKYGRTTCISETLHNKQYQTTFLYQNVSESQGVAKVEQMYDPFSESTYTYSYDEYNRCKGYTAISPTMSFGIQKESETTTAYKVTRGSGRGTRFSEEIYDKNAYLNPRIASTNSYAKNWIVTGRHYTESHIGDTKYTYDCLGRLANKCAIASITNNDDEIQTNYTYLYGTNLINKISVNYGSKLFPTTTRYYKSFDYSYDARGRIIKETNEKNESIDFLYDKANRLTYEQNVLGKCISYEYNIDGSIKSEITSDNSKVNYQYQNGRLISKGTKTFEYDNIGNCISYQEIPLEWYRGILLHTFGSDTDYTTYSYDSQGIRYKKENHTGTTTFIQDGHKLIEEIRNNKYINYLYDAEEIVGFMIDGDYYFFIKDVFKNVRSIIRIGKKMHQGSLNCEFSEVATYDYDSWGNCIVNKLSDVKIDGIHIADYNPIRWKSFYYDVESGFYYIDGRYYSPEMKQYINSKHPEIVLTNASTIYGLNLQSFTLTNPLDVSPNSYTIQPVSEIVYDPPTLSKWDQFWQGIGGKTFAVSLAVVASILCLLTGQVELLIVTIASTIGILALGGAIAGFSSMSRGKGFWRGFENYINNEWALNVAIVAILVCLSVCITFSRASTLEASINQSVVPEETSIVMADERYLSKKGLDIAESLGHDANGNTISSISKGKEIHNQFMLNEAGKPNGIRIDGAGRVVGRSGFTDGYDPVTKTIYELKPNNPASIKLGIRQLHRYAKAYEAIYGFKPNLVLVLY